MIKMDWFCYDEYKRILYVLSNGKDTEGRSEIMFPIIYVLTIVKLD